MTYEAAETDHSAVGHSCSHCDSADDHHSLDEKGIVDSFRATLNTVVLARLLLALALTVSALTWAWGAYLAGIGAWAVATLVGVVVVGATRSSRGPSNSVILGAVVSAALLPVGAWAVTVWVGSSAAVALAAGTGWFFAGAMVETIRDRQLSAVLIEDSREAEGARQGVLFGSPTSPWVGLGWSLFTAALFAAWVYLIGLITFVVIPLIPLQVALALLTRRNAKASS